MPASLSAQKNFYPFLWNTTDSLENGAGKTLILLTREVPGLGPPKDIWRDYKTTKIY